jgi:TRAP-type mannitol/chloroaromatic compound transport system substrate-binding protein
VQHRAALPDQAKYDARNPGALRRLVGGGAQLKPFPQEVMEAALKAGCIPPPGTTGIPRCGMP